MSTCVEANRGKAPNFDSSLKFILLLQLAVLALTGVDWLLQQFVLLPLTIGTHLLVATFAFYSARVMWRHHRQTVVPGLVDLTLRTGRQPDVIGPYNVFAYFASISFLAAVGYVIDTARLLSFTDFHIVALLMSH